MSESPGVPGQGWYVVAGAAALGGPLIAVALIAWMLLSSNEGTQFAAPGRAALELQADKYVVWNDFRTLFEGNAYQSPRDFPPGASIRVRAPGGADVATRRTAGEFNARPTDRIAMLTFEAAQAGRYEIAVEGSFPPRVVSVAPDRRLRPFIASAAAFASAIAGLMAGFAIWGWAYLKRDAAAEKAAASAPLTISPEDRPLRSLAALVYGLQLAVTLTGVSPVAGVIINYVKRDAVAGTWLESHFRWQIRTFWIAAAWTAIGVVLLMVFIGIFVLGVAAMWFLYRAIKGWIALSEGRPMYGP
jgi:uncharacterized membrane protein